MYVKCVTNVSNKPTSLFLSSQLKARDVSPVQLLIFYWLLRVDKPKTVTEETMRNYLHGNANLEVMLLFPFLCPIMYL